MCMYCLKVPCPLGCPNYDPPPPPLWCDICKEGIWDEEKYIMNNDKKFAHWDCFYDTQELAEWYGIEIETV